MVEHWKSIPNFEDYSVSDQGRVRAEKSERILALSQNQFGLVQVGMMRYGKQCHRSVPLLVARAFLRRSNDLFDTPINKDGDRWNNALENLLWRPRWFAIRYNQQFKYPIIHSIPVPLTDVKTGEVSENSFECAKRYGLLESDLVLSVFSHTYVWPTYQEFRVLNN